MTVGSTTACGPRRAAAEPGASTTTAAIETSRARLRMASIQTCLRERIFSLEGTVAGSRAVSSSSFLLRELRLRVGGGRRWRRRRGRLDHAKRVERRTLCNQGGGPARRSVEGEEADLVLGQMDRLLDTHLRAFSRHLLRSRA